MNDYPISPDRARIEIVAGIVLTLVTCGIYGLVWQYRQMETLNAWLGRDKYNFWVYLALAIVTCGIYAIYMEYVMANDINHIQRENNYKTKDDLALICLIMSIFGLQIVSLAVQQHEINLWYEAYL